MDKQETIAHIKKRIKNAKRRAMYWSGIASFSPYTRAKVESHEKYELALCDVHSLSTWLSSVDGSPAPSRRDYDPRRDFGARFVKMMGSVQ